MSTLHAYEIQYEFEGVKRTVFVIAADVVSAWQQVERAYPGSEVVNLSRRGVALAPEVSR